MADEQPVVIEEIEAVQGCEVPAEQMEALSVNDGTESTDAGEGETTAVEIFVEPVPEISDCSALGAPDTEEASVDEPTSEEQPAPEDAASEEPAATEEPATAEEPAATEEPATEEPAATDEPAATEEAATTDEASVDEPATENTTEPTAPAE